VLLGARSRHATANGKDGIMYIGIGTLVVIILLVILVMSLRGR
jgi:hypothetical protein